MKPVKSTRSILFAFLTVILVSCGNENKIKTTPENITPVIATIQVVPHSSERKIVETDTVPQNNCDGTAALKKTLERTRTIQYSLSAETGLTINADGSIGIPEIGKVSVGASVAAKYGVEYGKSEQLRRSLEHSAKEGSFITHTINLVEIWETGEFVVVSGNKTFKYPYKFLRDFDLDYVAAQQGMCVNSMISPTSLPSATAKCSLKAGQTVLIGENTNLWNIPDAISGEKKIL